MKMISIIDQQVMTNNPTLFERVIDKEVFEKVFKGVRQKLVPSAVNSATQSEEIAKLIEAGS